MIKVFRVLVSKQYVPNPAKVISYKYTKISQAKAVMAMLSPDHGFGRIKGLTKKVGANYSPVPVCVFKRSNRQLLWETKSKADGSYAFRNIAVGLECFVVAFDPNNQYNAVIQDKVIAK